MLFHTNNVPMYFRICEDFDENELVHLMKHCLMDQIKPAHNERLAVCNNDEDSAPSTTNNNQDKQLEDKSKFNMRINMSLFEPEEVCVKMDNNKLKIHAKHEEKLDTKFVYHEYSEEFQLPSGIDLSSLKATFNKEGVLAVEGSIPQLEVQNEKVIPIEFQH